MKRVTSALMLILLFTGCARVGFGTKWSLSPVLEPADVSATEAERRENERRQEVRLLKSERLALAREMQDKYLINLLGKIDVYFGPELRWDRYDGAQRVDIARTLFRVIEITQRLNVFTGRSDETDETIRRSRVLIGLLARWKPVALPHYAH